MSTSAKAQFDATISKDGTEINWEMSYSALEGSIQQSHIHVGQPAPTGRLGVPLHQPRPTAQRARSLPQGPATISGTISADAT